MTSPTRKRLLELDSKGKPTFRYVKAGETDVAATFRRIAREQQKSQSKPANVQVLARRKTA